MLTLILLTITILTLTAMIGIVYQISKRNAKKEPIEYIDDSSVLDTSDLSPSNFMIFNENGTIVLQSKELGEIPSSAKRLALSNNTVQQAIRLASDLFKASVGLPNKSIELVFRPEIQAGLKDGTYKLMQTKAGETLADAVNSSGKIVAKARVIETGKLRQFAAGGYQLVSIVVAQSHLADIERNLSALRNAIGTVLDNLESTDRANISGSISYLLNLGEYVKTLNAPKDIPEQIKSVIESLVLKSLIWRDKLHEDVANLTKRIEKQEDIDSWGGTENTYKALNVHAEEARALLARHELITQLYSLISFIVNYVDPLAKQYSRPDIGDQIWRQKTALLSKSLIKKAEEFLSTAIFNSEEMLAHRKGDIIRNAQELNQKAIEQQNIYHHSMSELKSTIAHYFNNNEGARIALTFDNKGAVSAAAAL